MRKCLLLFIAITMGIAVFGQKLQRLAILPSSMSVGHNLSSICIDLFRRAPIGKNYVEIGNSGRFWKVHFMDEVTGRIRPQTVKFAGPTNEPIPVHYQRFIKATIDKYGPGRLSPERLEQLQNEVWAYNGMDYFKSVDTKLPNQRIAYAEAKKNFAYKYGLREDGNDLEVKIILKLRQLHDIRLKQVPTAVITNVRFENDGISFRANGYPKKIEVDYDGVSSDNITITTSEIFNNIKEYQSKYKTLPKTATFSERNAAPFKYQLTFDIPYLSNFDMHFPIPNNGGTGKKWTHELLGAYYVKK